MPNKPIVMCKPRQELLGAQPPKRSFPRVFLPLYPPLIAYAIKPALFFLLCLCTPIVAQVNTERLRTNDVQEGFATAVGLDFNILAGNSEKFEIAPTIRLDYVNPHWTCFVVANYKKGESAGIDYTNKGFVHARLSVPVSPITSLEFFSQREFDTFRRITDRSLLGTGARIRLQHWHNFGAIYLGSGLMSEHETYKSNPASDLIRWTSYLSGHYSHLPFGLVGSLYVQPALTDFENLRLLCDVTASMAITTQLTWTFGFKLTYARYPQPGIKNHDIDIQNGIRWDF